MPITFDATNKLIILEDESPEYEITAQEIYNAAMDWADSQEAMDDDPPMRSMGFANLGGGIYSDKIFILQKGWKLKPYSGIYTLTCYGTLIALDDADEPYPRTVPPDSGTVIWIFQVTSQGILAQLDDIILTRKFQTNRLRIIGDQLIRYDDDGITILKTFNLSGTQTTPYSERTPA